MENEKKISQREASKKYRENLKKDPQKYQEFCEKNKERNKKRLEEIKKDPQKYQEHLEKERIRSKKKHERMMKDPAKHEKIKKYHRDYLKKNREKNKKFPSRNPENWKKINITRRYNITIEEYNILTEQQKGHCAICNKVPEKIFVDHCHVTGKVRGLLCLKCNSGIAFFYENREILIKAIEYLDKHNIKGE